ncbi:flippase [Chryseobacterium sp. GP-SGM7]|uniref:flippase n=1 Tax=Chryseobacterium sp. GP-SGM7 TaxID=3411323 RepID=UPI003B94A381
MIKSKLVGNIVSLGSVQIINYIFPLITVPYISRIIGPEGYGIINYSTSFITYFAILIAYGFDLSATRRIAHESHSLEKVSQIVSEVFTCRLILTGFAVIFFLLALYFFSPIQNYKFVVCILFIGAISNVLSAQYIFQGFQEMSVFAKANFVKGILNTILVFLCVKNVNDYIWIPVLTTFFLVGINFSLYYYSFRKFKLKFKFVSLSKASKVIFDDRMIFFSTIVISLYTTTNVVILGFFANTKDLGYFTTSQNFLNIVTSVVSIPLSNALYPFIGKAYAKSDENGLLIVKKIFPFVFYITFIASLGVLIFTPILINIFYGNKYENSILPLKIMSFLPFIIGMSNVFGIQIMLNMRLDKLFFKITLAASVIGVSLNYFMSKYFGYIGTAWNIVIVESFVTILMYIVLVKKNINIVSVKDFYFKNMFSLIKTKNYKD